MYRNILFALLVGTIFTACLNTYPEYYKFKYLRSTQITDFKEETKKLVMGMEESLFNLKSKVKNKHIYVVDFVNIRNLELTSQLGFFLSSEVKAHVSEEFGINVKELEYMKYIKLGYNGSKLLSRDLDEVQFNNVDKTYALVGTYAITQRQLKMYLKLINMKNGNIIKSTSHSIEITDEIIKLEEEKRDNPDKTVLRPRVVL